VKVDDATSNGREQGLVLNRVAEARRQGPVARAAQQGPVARAAWPSHFSKV